jgi:hypothetical protein
MAKRTGDTLLLHDRVVNNVALPGVPAGTAGKVILVNGFRWIRYRVLFDTGVVNGADVGSLDRKVLTLVDKKGNPV